MKHKYNAFNIVLDYCIGIDCTVSFKRDGNKIVTTTKNLGIALNVTTTIVDDSFDVYVSLTGDQCAITNINILNT